MTKATLFYRKNLLTKLFMLVMLLGGGGSNVWGDDIVIYNEGSELPSGWDNYYDRITVSENKLVAADILSYITSQSTYTFSNKHLVVVAKKTNETDAYVRLQDNSSGSFANIGTIGYGTTASFYDMFSNDFMHLIFDVYSVSDKRIRIACKNVIIKSIKFCDDISLSLDEQNLYAISSMKSNKTETVTLRYSATTGWNTICVPFQLKSGSSFEHFTEIFGSGWKAYTLSSYDSETRILTFEDAVPNNWSSVNANVPLLVYAPNAETNETGIVLSSNVKIVTVQATKLATNKSDVVFQGTYAPITAGNFTSSMYGVTNSGQVRPGDGVYANIKGYRAYFTGISALAGARVSIVLEGDDGTTDLGFVKMVDENAKDIYTLSGQKVQKGGKGIYIVNGRKVVIK